MARCVRLAPLLLTHLNVVLAMFAGGALVTAARFKWDPSTYVVVRELFPLEYRVSAGVLTGTGFALLLLTHFAIVALAMRRRSTRRVLLILYATLMCALAAVAVAWCAWMAHRLVTWLHTTKAERILEALQYRDNLKPILSFLGRLHPLPEKIKHLLEEVEEDVPRNMYAMIAGAVLLAVTHTLAVTLASALAVCSPRERRLSHSSWVTTSTSVTGSSSEKAPLRTAYRNGRIVIL